MKFISLLFFILISNYSYAEKISYEQHKNLAFAYSYGKILGWEETIPSILYQETKAGYFKYKNNGVIIGDLNNKGKPKSLGIMQVQLPSARDVEKWYPDIFQLKFKNKSPTDEELIIALLTDDYFNIIVGSHYFLKMHELTGNWRKAILAYNRGPNNNGLDPNNYVKKVLFWRKKIILPLMKENKL